MDYKPLKTMCYQKSLSKANMSQLKTMFGQGRITKDNVNSIDEKGNTVLLAAIERGHDELIMMIFDLFEQDSELALDVNCCDKYGNSVLMLCVSSQLNHLVSKLVDLGADANMANKKGETALTMTVASGDNSMLDELSRLGNIDLNVTTGELCRTPLHLSVLSDNDAFVVKLVEMKADLDQFDNDGNTALHLACLNDSQNLGTHLVRQGADIHVQNNDGDTALHIAEREQRKKLAEVLLAMGADDSIANNEGETAAELATEANREAEAALDIKQKELRQRRQDKADKTMDEVSEFLEKAGLQHHAQFFTERKYKLRTLLNIKEAKLKALGFPPADIPALMAALSADEEENEIKSSDEVAAARMRTIMGGLLVMFMLLAAGGMALLFMYGDMSSFTTINDMSQPPPK